MSHLSSAFHRPPQQHVRRDPRLRLPAMYTLVRVRPAGADRYRWTGHIYDVSLSGMRFELDQPLEPGTTVDVRVMLPGLNQVVLRATGRVVRLHEDEHDAPAGPVRMAMTFDRFASELDHRRLSNYLATADLRQAA